MKAVSLSFRATQQRAPLLGLVSMLATVVALNGCATRTGQAAGQVTPSVSESQRAQGPAPSAGEQDLLRRLREAEHADRMNSTSWSDTNVTLGTAYAIKAREVRHVIGRIERGEPVSQREIKRALDNSTPYQLGGYP
jgi:hypothetical protein